MSFWELVQEMEESLKTSPDILETIFEEFENSLNRDKFKVLHSILLLPDFDIENQKRNEKELEKCAMICLDELFSNRSNRWKIASSTASVTSARNLSSLDPIKSSPFVVADGSTAIVNGAAGTFNTSYYDPKTIETLNDTNTLNDNDNITVIQLLFTISRFMPLRTVISLFTAFTIDHSFKNGHRTSGSNYNQSASNNDASNDASNRSSYLKYAKNQFHQLLKTEFQSITRNENSDTKYSKSSPNTHSNDNHTKYSHFFHKLSMTLLLFKEKLHKSNQLNEILQYFQYFFNNNDHHDIQSLVFHHWKFLIKNFAFDSNYLIRKLDLLLIPIWSYVQHIDHVLILAEITIDGDIRAIDHSLDNTSDDVQISTDAYTRKVDAHVCNTFLYLIQSILRVYSLCENNHVPRINIIQSILKYFLTGVKILQVHLIHVILPLICHTPLNPKIHSYISNVDNEKTGAYINSDTWTFECTLENAVVSPSKAISIPPWITEKSWDHQDFCVLFTLVKKTIAFMAENESPSTLIQDFLNLFQNMISYCNLNWVPSICQVMPSFPDWILFIEFISKTPSSFAYYDRMIHILCESLAVQSCTTHQSCPLSLKVEALLEKIQKNLHSSSKDYEVITAKLHDMQTKLKSHTRKQVTSMIQSSSPVRFTSFHGSTLSPLRADDNSKRLRASDIEIIDPGARKRQKREERENQEGSSEFDKENTCNPIDDDCISDFKNLTNENCKKQNDDRDSNVNEFERPLIESNLENAEKSTIERDSKNVEKSTIERDSKNDQTDQSDVEKMNIIQIIKTGVALADEIDFLPLHQVTDLQQQLCLLMMRVCKRYSS